MKKKPHFVLAMVGEEEITPAHIDFFTHPIYFGHQGQAGSSGGRYCTIKINVINGLAYVVQHELGHSLGAKHTNERGCIMQPAMVHGRKTNGWSRQNRNTVEESLCNLGI
jgi:predicted Zn-dependent protease